MSCSQLYKDSTGLYNMDFDLDINDNLNIDNEANNKTSSKVLNSIISKQCSDSNFIISKNSKLRNTLSLQRETKSDIFSNK